MAVSGRQPLFLALIQQLHRRLFNDWILTFLKNIRCDYVWMSVCERALRKSIKKIIRSEMFRNWRWEDPNFSYFKCHNIQKKLQLEPLSDRKQTWSQGDVTCGLTTVCLRPVVPWTHSLNTSHTSAVAQAHNNHTVNTSLLVVEKWGKPPCCSVDTDT